MDNSSIIEIEDLVKRFPMGRGEFTALNGIDLTLRTGEFSGLIGPSGSGKTTLLNIIGSLDTPSSGLVTVLGKPIAELNAKEAARLRKESLGFIFQSYNLLAVHTVYENVEFPLLLLGLSSPERKKMVMDALEWVGLTDKMKSKPPQLSGGECQRVAVARAMVKRPSLVLADEPTANLDAANSHNILKTMENLNRELKTTFLFATHDDKVINYLHRRIFLIDGRIDKDEIVTN
ncbi:MAG TPA: ABC transporter ATP-binding protein [Bacteroidales bacterium]|jgi:putative ABC transport system ATP-binding protein|nr:ATP-binding cassette domain-containing protein [Bacteroidales bacterium]OQB57518.1 MAG: ABC transporter ATP-binding protein YtrE [Bacteroidetes bacterium ADurb.Bin145]HOU02308.1 ABC transporter ATP-binding protein [Bacteroidales bacterium]HQG62852.1 ABC transporter ATP-binding protein [Bacteroidales bacterium]HQK68313.1 ABC transporter ATP-binding protein [Bacteroidales bacterium]